MTGIIITTDENNKLISKLGIDIFNKGLFSNKICIETEEKE